MLNTDPEARTDPQLRLAPRAERFGAERSRQFQRQRRIVTVAAVVLFLMAFGIARAWAWTAAISGEGVCNTQTGQYDLAWTLDNTSEPEPASVTGDLTATVPAHGTKTVSESVPGSTSGSVSRTVRINWPSDQANLERTATVELTGDCKKPTPPTTTTPPPDDTPKLGPPDQHRAPPVVPPIKKAPPEVTPPTETPGTLPFTGPRDWLLPVGLGLFVAGAAMVLAGRRRWQRMGVAARAFDRAMHKPYDGPRERL